MQTESFDNIYDLGKWCLAGDIENLALHHQKSPPTINIDNQDPECDLDYCANVARDLNINVAVKNNFGFGGTNGTLVFRRY